MSINVGDAVQYFTADTTQLDQAYQRINQGSSAVSGADRQVKQLDEDVTKTSQDFSFMGESGLAAGNEVGEGMEKAGFSAREAKAEIGLVGEEIGVNLPRHVRGFVAELPGVGQALSAAFEATAILFVLQAIVEVTEKVTSFISDTLIYTQAMKDADASTAKLNTTILESSVALDKAKESFQLLGLEGSAKTKVEFNQLQEQIEKLNLTVEDNVNHIARLRDGTSVLGLTGQAAADKMNELTQANKALQTQIQTLQYAEAQLSDQYTKDLQKEGDEAEKEAQREAAARHQVGVELFDLYQKQLLLRQAQEATREALQAAAPEVSFITKATYSQADAMQAIINVTPEVNAHLATMAKQFTAADLAFAKFVTDARKNVPTLRADFKSIKDLAVTAFQDMQKAVSSATNAYVLGSATIGQALKLGLQQELATIASRAEVKAIEELAYGFATLFTNPAESGAHFTAAALFGTIGAATAVAGHALGSNAPQGSAGNAVFSPTASPVSQPQQNPTNVQNVQRLAAGGLISQPTLAVIGDSIHGGSAREAVVPLDDPKAASAISDALGGSQGDVHVHVKGVISADNLNKVVKKMARGINNGSARFAINQGRKIIRNSKF